MSPGGGTWLQRDGFGTVPEYLQRVKQRVAEEHAAAERAEAERASAEEAKKGRRLGPEEREALLDALKARWDAVNAEYGLFSFKRISTANSTVSEIRRKERCERELGALEGDIRRLSAPGPVYVLSED